MCSPALASMNYIYKQSYFTVSLVSIPTTIVSIVWVTRVYGNTDCLIFTLSNTDRQQMQTQPLTYAQIDQDHFTSPSRGLRSY